MNDTAYNTPELEALRQRIDTLDQRLHNTLMERADLVLKIGEEKKKHNLQVIQPAREARMIRKLLARHEGRLPTQAVIHIWREMVGAVSLLQTDLRIVALKNEDHSFETLARNYFGACPQITFADTADAAVRQVQDKRADFAIVPWPEFEDAHRWWIDLAESNAKIIAALPHYIFGDKASVDRRAVVVSRGQFIDSGDDGCFIYICSNGAVSRAKIVEIFKICKLPPVGLSVNTAVSSTDDIHYLIETEGFIDKDSETFHALRSALAAIDIETVSIIGGFPKPVKIDNAGK